MLRANVMVHELALVESWYELGYYSGENGYSISSPAQYNNFWSSARVRSSDRAYARIRGKLYSGSAALGVTFASWKQSADMIRSRSNLIRSQADVIASLHSRRRISKKLAATHLEVIFGWAPLINDIHASTYSVIQDADKYAYVRGTGSEDLFSKTVYKPSERVETVILDGRVRCTQAVQVTIANPNRWLAERAGLLNPLAVAWDLVPFSFLINMVSNVGHLVNYVTDFTGLSFSNGSRTYRHDVRRTITFSDLRYGRVGEKGQIDRLTYKQRELLNGSPIGPTSLAFRAPDVNWDTAAMAASLMVQKSVPVLRLIPKLRKIINS
jgi:hypothetical protein